MCGICLILYNEQNGEAVDEETFVHLQRRGPDAHGRHDIQLSDQLYGAFFGYTLHFRGCLTRQPLVDAEGNVLLWNGELFYGLEVRSDCNDGNVILKKLSTCTEDAEVVQLFGQILGPWAFIYWNKSQGKLWFGRDIFGRRSLLCRTSDDNQTLSFASLRIDKRDVCEDQAWMEVPSHGIYCADLKQGTLPDSFTLFPWCYSSPDHGHCTPSLEQCVLFNQNLTTSLCGLPVHCASYAVTTAFCELNQREPDPDVANHLKLTGAKVPPLNPESSNPSLLESVVVPEQSKLAEKLIEILGEAVRVRVECQSQVCHRCMPAYLDKLSVPADNNHCSSLCDFNYCGHARTAVLFSGGIDSLVVAALAHRFIPPEEPIDLLNVAFQQCPKVDNSKHKSRGPNLEETQDRKKGAFDVPDRETGRAGVDQLRSIAPDREWNFVEINVTLEELQDFRSSRVCDLVYPLNTVLDDSIGCAVWFAARGKGLCSVSGSGPVPYETTARVVLVGMGADEQFAGYSRHRVKFNQGGWPALTEEIRMEIERISSRNLGRDDRIISDHAKESRFPYLDEHLVSFLNQTPLWLKTNLHLPRGVGEKLLLRYAASKLGLTSGAMLPKRAIQFGSRIAKAENRKEKASDVSQRLN